MEIKNYKRRIVDDKIEHYLKLFGAVCIEGPKYCGKTWAGRYHSNSEVLLHKTTGETSNNNEKIVRKNSKKNLAIFKIF